MALRSGITIGQLHSAGYTGFGALSRYVADQARSGGSSTSSSGGSSTSSSGGSSTSSSGGSSTSSSQSTSSGSSSGQYSASGMQIVGIVNKPVSTPAPLAPGYMLSSTGKVVPITTSASKSLGGSSGSSLLTTTSTKPTPTATQTTTQTTSDRGSGTYINNITGQGISAIKDPGAGYTKVSYEQAAKQTQVATTPTSTLGTKILGSSKISTGVSTAPQSLLTKNLLTQTTPSLLFKNLSAEKTTEKKTTKTTSNVSPLSQDLVFTASQQTSLTPELLTRANQEMEQGIVGAGRYQARVDDTIRNIATNASARAAFNKLSAADKNKYFEAKYAAAYSVGEDLALIVNAYASTFNLPQDKAKEILDKKLSERFGSIKEINDQVKDITGTLQYEAEQYKTRFGYDAPEEPSVFAPKTMSVSDIKNISAKDLKIKDNYVPGIETVAVNKKIEKINEDFLVKDQEVTTLGANLKADIDAYNALSEDKKTAELYNNLLAQKNEFDRQYDELKQLEATSNQKIEELRSSYYAEQSDALSKVNTASGEINRIIYGTTNPTDADKIAYNLKTYGVAKVELSPQERATTAEQKKFAEIRSEYSPLEYAGLEIIGDPLMKSQTKSVGDIFEQARTKTGLEGNIIGDIINIPIIAGQKIGETIRTEEINPKIREIDKKIAELRRSQQEYTINIKDNMAITQQINELKNERTKLLQDEAANFRFEAYDMPTENIKRREDVGRALTNIDYGGIEYSKTQPYELSAGDIAVNIGGSTIIGGALGSAPGAISGFIGGTAGTIADLVFGAEAKRKFGDEQFARDVGMTANIITDIGVSGAADILLTKTAAGAKLTKKIVETPNVQIQNIKTLGSQSFSRQIDDIAGLGTAYNITNNIQRVSVVAKVNNKTIEKTFDVFSKTKLTLKEIKEAFANADIANIKGKIIDPVTGELRSADTVINEFATKTSTVTNELTNPKSSVFFEVAGKQDVFIKPVGGKLSSIADSIQNFKTTILKKDITALQEVSGVVKTDNFVKSSFDLSKKVEKTLEQQEGILGSVRRKLTGAKRTKTDIQPGLYESQLLGGVISEGPEGSVLAITKSKASKLNPLTGEFDDLGETISKKFSFDEDYIEGKMTRFEPTKETSGKSIINRDEYTDVSLTVGKKIDTTLETSPSGAADLPSFGTIDNAPKLLSGDVGDIGKSFDLERYAEKVLSGDNTFKSVVRQPTTKELTKSVVDVTSQSSVEDLVKTKIIEDFTPAPKPFEELYGYQVALRSRGRYGGYDTLEQVTSTTRPNAGILSDSGLAKTDIIDTANLGGILDERNAGLATTKYDVPDFYKNDMLTDYKKATLDTYKTMSLDSVTKDLVRTKDQMLETSGKSDLTTTLTKTSAKTDAIERFKELNDILPKVTDITSTKIRLKDLEETKIKEPGFKLPVLPPITIPPFGFLPPIPGIHGGFAAPGGFNMSMGQNYGGRKKKPTDLIAIKSSLFRKFATGGSDILATRENVARLKSTIAKKGTFLGYDIIPTQEELNKLERKRLKNNKLEKSVLGNFADMRI